MDNVTHTLAGMLLAEAAVQLRTRAGQGPSASFRTAAYVASVIANNAPDLDFVYARITEPPLGYLLHHRGHSHTVPIAIVIGVMTAAVVSAVSRRRGIAWSRADDRSIVALACLGPLVHIGMDFSNNYGVHPFWPAYAGWMYGDSVFIVEPLVWAVAIPSLVFAAETRVTRFVLATVLVFGLALSWALSIGPSAETRLVPTPMALAVTLISLGALLAAWRASPRTRPALGLFGSAAVAAMFFTASHAAAASVRGSPVLAGTMIHDIVITPMPANPLCAAVLVVGTIQGDYVVKRATVATLPSLFPSERCPAAADGHPTAPRSILAEPPSASITWKDEFRAPLHELVALATENCQVAAFLRFARVPYWTATGANELVVGDLRFDRNPGLDFSDMRIERRPAVPGATLPIACPKAVPPWLPPRNDLLHRETQ